MSGSIPGRSGSSGHSARGVTALPISGARADFNLMAAFREGHPDDWGCAHTRARGTSANGPAIVEGRDPRVTAAALMAPAIGEVFTKEGLAGVKIPVRLWVGARDTTVPDAATFRTKLPVPPDYHLVPNGGHFS